MNPLAKLNPTLFRLIVALGLLDLVFGLGTLLVDDALLVQQQNYVVGVVGKNVLGIVFTLKAILILYGCFFSPKYRFIQNLMIVGLLMWTMLAIIALIGFVSGIGTSIFGLGLFTFMAYLRWLLIKFVPPKEVV